MGVTVYKKTLFATNGSDIGFEAAAKTIPEAVKTTVLSPQKSFCLQMKYLMR